jgi:hypothetical protein
MNFFQAVNYLTLLDRSLIYFTERGRMAVHLGNVDSTKRMADLVGHLADVGSKRSSPASMR